jgi:AcrR family transcriptional regulator
MPRKPSTEPRKLPQQERSRIAVEAILEATTRILTEEGYEKANTNRIAERAGVSIGSLYQYFPNKESLMTALMVQHSDEIVELVESKYRNRHERCKCRKQTNGLSSYCDRIFPAGAIHPTSGWANV